MMDENKGNIDLALNPLDVLLGIDAQPTPEAQVKQLRLSQQAGKDVIFTLKALSYDRVEEIKRMHIDDMSLYILLDGCKNPNLRDKELLAHYHAPTPAELVKKLLLPGEIEDLSRKVERLSGYRVATVEEVKKK